MSDYEVDVVGVGVRAPTLSLEPDSTADSIEQLDETLNMTLDNDTTSTLSVIDTSTTQSDLDITSNTSELDLPSTSTSSTQEEPKHEPHRSRELTLLLALSKEAKLDTNLSRKRKIASPKRRNKNKKFHKHITGDNELGEEDADKARKRKSVSETEGLGSESFWQGGKALLVDVPVFKPNKDMFCWRCHKDTVDIACETCPRSYHRRCLKQAVKNPDHWPCPECVLILKAENTQSMSPAMKDMTLQHLCSLLKFAIKRMIKCQGSEPFRQPVSEAECPDYSKYIIQPMNLSMLSQNIKENLYGSPQAFEADAKWILHNSIIFNSSQSKMTNHAKSIIKICKQEMAEIENCSSCYENANSNNDWFVDVCPKPHLLVWAKLRGFPFWPGKVMSYKDGNVDVRFFGAHDRAWIPEEDCFLFSKKDPNFFRVRKKEIEDCVKELESHVKNLEKAFGEFRYAPFKTPVDPDNELKQLQIFLPRYRPGKMLKKHRKSETNEVRVKLAEKIQEKDDENPDEESGKEQTKSNEFGQDETMDGYGTDDDSISEMNTEFRKNLLNKSKSSIKEDNLETSSNADSSNAQELEKLIKKHSDKSKTDSPNKRASLESRNSDTENETSLRKINRIDFICDSMELSLGNESVELKKAPIQVDINNSEVAISAPSKLKMADKLMKRLSDEGEQNLIEEASSEDVQSSSSESSIIVDDVVEKDKNKESEEIVITPEKEMEDLQTDSVIETSTQSIEMETASEDVAEKSTENEIAVESTEIDNANEIIADNSPESVMEYDETADAAEANEDLTVNRENIIKIIHSSLEAPITKPPAELKRGNKRKKSSTSDIEIVETQNKIVKLASPLDKASILKCTLQKTNKGTQEDLEQNEIKDEPEEVVDDQNIAAKKKYLSALNILEKGEAVTEKSSLNVIRTRSKTEEKREKNRVSDNMTKVIEDVVVNYGARKISSTASKSDSQEIFVKSFAKIGSDTVEQRSSPTTNQRARKSFPQPNYVKQPAKLNSIIVAPKLTTSAISVVSSPIITTTTVAKTTTMPPLQPIEGLRPATNGYLILQPPQQDGTGGGMVFVPPTRNITYTNTGLANQMVSMTPCLVTTSTNNTSSTTISPRSLMWLPQTEPSMTQINLNSQNYIPQGENIAASGTVNGTSETSNTLVNGHVEANRVSPRISPRGASSASTVSVTESPDAASESENDSIQIIEPASVNETDDDLSLLNSIMPENVTRAVGEIIRRPPPKLKPRPPGALSQHFSEGIPSSAGPITSKINSIAHRLGDYFRGMLIETLEDLAKSGDAEATIVNLKLELEQLKHQHQVDLKEIEKNTATVMRDVQKCVADDRERAVEEARVAWEAEAVQRVEEAKSKQWCANCSKEAQLYCCWNTSYCDYPCQQKHWPTHLSKCSQNSNQATTSAGVTLRPGPGANQIFLRPALNPPPKGSSVGKIISTKPMQKVYLNRGATTSLVAKPKTMRVQTSSGSLLTMKETTPGNFQLVTTTPAVRPASAGASINNGKQQGHILAISSPPVTQSPPRSSAKGALRIVPQTDEETLSVD